MQQGVEGRFGGKRQSKRTKDIFPISLTTIAAGVNDVPQVGSSGWLAMGLLKVLTHRKQGDAKKRHKLF